MQTKTYHTVVTENDLNAAMQYGDKSYSWGGTTCVLAQAIARTVGSPLSALGAISGDTENGLHIYGINEDALKVQKAFDRDRFEEVKSRLPIQLDFTAKTENDNTFLP